MHTLQRLTIACCVTATLVGPARAEPGEEWTSPDGAISVTAPDAPRFVRLDEPPPPFLALWVSRDESLRLGVLKMEAPPRGKLNCSATEEGLAEEVHGKITSSSTLRRSGHELCVMTAEGSSQGTKRRITQAIAQIDGSAYKVMAGHVGEGPPDDEAMSEFVESIKITTPHLVSVPAAIHEGAQTPENLIDWHTTSKQAGGAAVLLLVVIAIWVIARRKKMKGSASSPDR